MAPHPRAHRGGLSAPPKVARRTDRPVDWVESRGIETRSIRIVRDLVAGVSPAFGYVELKDDSRIQEAITVLNGKRLRNQTILVKEAQVQTTGAGRGGGMERRTA